MFPFYSSSQLIADTERACIYAVFSDLLSPCAKLALQGCGAGVMEDTRTHVSQRRLSRNGAADNLQIHSRVDVIFKWNHAYVHVVLRIESNLG